MKKRGERLDEEEGREAQGEGGVASKCEWVVPTWAAPGGPCQWTPSPLLCRQLSCLCCQCH